MAKTELMSKAISFLFNKFAKFGQVPAAEIKAAAAGRGQAFTNELRKKVRQLEDRNSVLSSLADRWKKVAGSARGRATASGADSEEARRLLKVTRKMRSLDRSTAAWKRHDLEQKIAQYTDALNAATRKPAERTALQNFLRKLGVK